LFQERFRALFCGSISDYDISGIVGGFSVLIFLETKKKMENQKKNKNHQKKKKKLLEVRAKKSDFVYLMKPLDLKTLQDFQQDWRSYVLEKLASTGLHQNKLNIRKAFKTSEKLYLITEHFPRQELFYYVLKTFKVKKLFLKHKTHLTFSKKKER
jgi:hypothetical protein